MEPLPDSPWTNLRQMLARRTGRDYRLTSYLFLRLLGMIYLCAFGSLYPQLPGLIGSHGVAPARSFLRAVQEQLGPTGFWQIPTLAWGNPTDGFLVGLCIAGIVLSLLLILDILPTLALLGLYLCYLSLVSIGQDFLSFQWDSLLLETGLLALFLSPGWHLRPRLPGSRRTPAAPSQTVIWLLRWLLFRLMFFSGVVKLASGDPAWHSLNAMRYHYLTQPLPTPLAWYLYQLPAGFHRLETAAVFVLELPVPFLVLLPWRRARLAAAVLTAFLQILILLTGNYGYFNLLTLALCVLLLDDAALVCLVPLGWRARVTPPAEEVSSHSWMPLRRGLLLPFVALIVLLSFTQISGTFLGGATLPGPALGVAERAEPFRVFNSYGLFAVMTTTRPEIVIEGSNDGKRWQEYGFRYKPGDLNRAPQWIWPHQPRLDWQMWFAALGGPGSDPPPWFRNLLLRLLQGEPETMALLETNPFPQSPPRYIRAALYDYRFTDLATRRATGAWWQRRLLNTYFPQVSLHESVP